MSAGDMPATPCAEQVLGELRLGVDRLAPASRRTSAASSSSNRSGSSARTVSTTSNANAMCIDSSRNTQLVPGGQPVEQAARAQEVDVGERAVEEQPLDAGGEADQVEQERPPVLPASPARSSSKTESIHRKQKSALRLIDGMFSTAANASCRSFSSGT